MHFVYTWFRYSYYFVCVCFCTVALLQRCKTKHSIFYFHYLLISLWKNKFIRRKYAAYIYVCFHILHFVSHKNVSLMNKWCLNFGIFCHFTIRLKRNFPLNLYAKKEKNRCFAGRAYFVWLHLVVCAISNLDKIGIQFGNNI